MYTVHCCGSYEQQAITRNDYILAFPHYFEISSRATTRNNSLKMSPVPRYNVSAAI